MNNHLGAFQYSERNSTRIHRQYAEKRLEEDFSSGTTGLPKGALLSHRNAVFQGTAMADTWGIDHDDTTLVHLTPSHVGGSTELLGTVFVSRSEAVLLDAFDPETLSIAPGTKVKFVWDSGGHNANPKSGDWSHQPIENKGFSGRDRCVGEQLDLEVGCIGWQSLDHAAQVRPGFDGFEQGRERRHNAFAEGRDLVFPVPVNDPAPFDKTTENTFDGGL